MKTHDRSNEVLGWWKVFVLKCKFRNAEHSASSLELVIDRVMVA